jgi:3D (Asp-Asp-Asp) domain-containing protein
MLHRPRLLLSLLPAVALVLTACSSGGSGPAGATARPSAAATAPASRSVPPPVVARRGQPLGAFTVTCHTGSGKTASGRTDGPGLTAVDPDVLPLGTRVQVEKVGMLTAADSGGALSGKSLDFWAPSVASCASFGRQRLQVWRPVG